MTNMIRVVESEMVIMALGGDEHKAITLTETDVLHVHRRLTGLLEEAFIHLHEPKLVQLFMSWLASNTDVTANRETVSELSMEAGLMSVEALCDCYEEKVQEPKVAAALVMQLGRQSDGCGAAPEPSTKGDPIDDVV
uniref:BACK domain-containing protein n=1 Tax=Mesocestoides corti TaxID=53468 RepID=A0A5K3FV38_MESCO